MPKVNIQKARKEYTCRKCKSTINVGDKYYKYAMFRSKPTIRCINCKPKPSDLTSSEYLTEIYLLQESDYGDYTDNVESLVETLEVIKEGCEERFESIPESLQYAPNGEMLQERIDCLESAISDLEDIDEFDDSMEVEEDETIEELREEWEEECYGIIESAIESLE
jgi:hypothetical protein